MIDRSKWEFVSDYMIEQLNALLEGEFLEWQENMGIEDGGLPPELEFELDVAFNKLLDVFNSCVTWQAEQQFEG